MVASFSYDPLLAVADHVWVPQEIVFTDTSTPYGEYSRLWLVNSVHSGSGETLQHNFALTGFVPIELQIINADYTEVQHFSKTFTCIRPPVASFTASKQFVLVGETITFTNTSNGHYNEVEWFVNGIALGWNISFEHIFQTTGIYAVKLKVTALYGANGEPIEHRESIAEIKFAVVSAPTDILSPSVDLIEGNVLETLFTFSVTYVDVNNAAPKAGYPRCYILLGEKEVKSGLMSPVEFMDMGYTDGKEYQYKCPLPYRGEYTFWFEAFNNTAHYEDGVYVEGDYARCDGTQTISVSGVNAAPELVWTGEEGYANGGVLSSNAIGGSIEFRIKYVDANNDFPQDVIVSVSVADYDTGAEVFSSWMEVVSGSPAIGMIFSVATVLPFDGRNHRRFKYKFSANDTLGEPAIGVATVYYGVVTVSMRPVLHYVGGERFENSYVDHVENEDGTITITAKVMYAHPVGGKPYSGYPKWRIFRKGIELAGESPREMKTDGSDYANGAVYIGSYKTPLGYPERAVFSDYTFSLECKNRWGTEFDGTVYPPIQSVAWQAGYGKQTDLAWKYVWVDTTKPETRIEPLLNITQGNPYRYCINTNLIVLDATQQGSLLVDYYSTPSKMTSESDNLSVPDCEAEALVLYMLERVYKKLNQWDESRIVQRDYNERITVVHKMAQTQRPNLFFEPGGGY